MVFTLSKVTIEFVKQLQHVSLPRNIFKLQNSHYEEHLQITTTVTNSSTISNNKVVSCRQNAVCIICLQQDNINLQIRSAPKVAPFKQVLIKNSNIVNSEKPLSKQYKK